MTSKNFQNQPEDGGQGDADILEPGSFRYRTGRTAARFPAAKSSPPVGFQAELHLLPVRGALLCRRQQSVLLSPLDVAAGRLEGSGEAGAVPFCVGHDLKGKN